MHLVILISLIFVGDATAAGGRPASDPSVPDQTDINIINEFLNGKGDNPSRDALSKDTGPATNTTKDGEPCKCVKYYLCDMAQGQNSSDNGQEILGKVDVRVAELKNDKNQTEGFQCESYFDVCCPMKQIKASNDTQSPTPTISGSSGSPSINEDKGQHKYCGRRNEKGVGFTMKGATQNEAEFGEFPWTAAIIQLEPLDDNPNVTVHKYIGGGSLLHPQVVLTVAHNVLGKSRTTLKVRLGEWDTQTNDEPYPSQDRKVRKVIIHEQFVQKRLFNDIALLILEEGVKFAPNVDTVCLPPLNKFINFEGQMCHSAGWGKDHFGAEGRYSEIQKKVSVPVVSHDKCQAELQKSDKLPGFRLDKSFLCAGGNGPDTCKGDGGAPLVCSADHSNHPHYIQIGSVSWGLGCGSTSYPGVYSNVTLATPWILKQMQKEGFSTEYCTIND